MFNLNQFAWWRNHATKYIGTAITIISGALALNLVPAKYVQIAEGVLAFLGGGAVKRGFTNNAIAPSPPSA